MSKNDGNGNNKSTIRYDRSDSELERVQNISASLKKMEQAQQSVIAKRAGVRQDTKNLDAARKGRDESPGISSSNSTIGTGSTSSRSSPKQQSSYALSYNADSSIEVPKSMADINEWASQRESAENATSVHKFTAVSSESTRVDANLKQYFDRIESMLQNNSNAHFEPKLHPSVLEVLHDRSTGNPNFIDEQLKIGSKTKEALEKHGGLKDLVAARGLSDFAKQIGKDLITTPNLSESEKIQVIESKFNENKQKFYKGNEPLFETVAPDPQTLAIMKQETLKLPDGQERWSKVSEGQEKHEEKVKQNIKHYFTALNEVVSGNDINPKELKNISSLVLKGINELNKKEPVKDFNDFCDRFEIPKPLQKKLQHPAIKEFVDKNLVGVDVIKEKNRQQTKDDLASKIKSGASKNDLVEHLVGKINKSREKDSINSDGEALQQAHEEAKKISKLIQYESRSGLGKLFHKKPKVNLQESQFKDILTKEMIKDLAKVYKDNKNVRDENKKSTVKPQQKKQKGSQRE